MCHAYQTESARVRRKKSKPFSRGVLFFWLFLRVCARDGARRRGTRGDDKIAKFTNAKRRLIKLLRYYSNTSRCMFSLETFTAPACLGGRRWPRLNDVRQKKTVGIKLRAGRNEKQSFSDNRSRRLSTDSSIVSSPVTPSKTRKIYVAVKLSVQSIKTRVIHTHTRAEVGRW